MDHAISLHKYNPLRANYFSFSYLIFTDDILIVGKMDIDTVNSLNHILNILERYLGLIANKDKFVFYYLGHNRSLSLLEYVLGLKQGSFPLKYLGLPWVKGALKSNHFISLFDKLFG